MNVNKYKFLVVSLVADGEMFDREPCQLSHCELTKYHELAKSYGYKKPVLHSRGYGFYMLLRRVYNSLKNDSSFINSVAELSRMKAACGIK